MGRKLHYKPGSFYRVDDRSGFVQRAERTKEEWDGSIVADSLWERRQPQDLVRGVKDDQTVPKARPLGANVFVGPIYVALSASAGIGATSLTLDSIAGLSNGDRVGVMLDNGSMFNATISAPPSSSGITISQGLPYTAASGNLVTDYERPVTIDGGV